MDVIQPPKLEAQIMRYELTDYEWRGAVKHQSYRTTEDGRAFTTRGQLLSDWTLAIV
jgi:hypothetical protein